MGGEVLLELVTICEISAVQDTALDFRPAFLKLFSSGEHFH